MIQLGTSVLSADIQNDLVVVATKDSLMLWNIYDLVDPIDTIRVNAVCVVRFCHSYGDHGRDSGQDGTNPVLSSSVPLSTPVKQHIQSPYVSAQSQFSATQTRFSATQPQFSTTQLQSPLHSSQPSSIHQSPSTPSKSTYTAQSLSANPPISPLHPLPDTSQHASLQQLNSLDSFQGSLHHES